jgi:hypothetical protein
MFTKSVIILGFGPTLGISLNVLQAQQPAPGWSNRAAMAAAAPPISLNVGVPRRGLPALRMAGTGALLVIEGIGKLSPQRGGLYAA